MKKKKMALEATIEGQKRNERRRSKKLNGIIISMLNVPKIQKMKREKIKLFHGECTCASPHFTPSTCVFNL